ncbi:hypothetical protein [Pedobacter aquatilis]|uniref:hypothetical protein n=1 Tax=Pedobacter aquatilis TaxID=351343 RepID=UPI00292D4451|nr:hypothetical protein [Pedobacter aquatilis]
MNKTINLILSFLLLFCFSACKKSEAEADLVDGTNLTECPISGSCNFLFANNSGMSENNLLLSKGQYRVFWAQTSLNGTSTALYMMAPMNGDRFTMDKTDILEGRVKYFSSCVSCFAINMVLVDGTIKGQKVKQQAGLPEKWLVESDVVLAASENLSYRVPLHFKQYYLPAN